MKYSDFCYTGIFDEFFNIIWSDNHELFSRISRRHKILQKRLYRAGFSDTIYYNFRANGIEYSVKANMLRDRRIICRIYQEMPEEVLSREELFEDIDNIRHGSLNAISMAQMIQGYVNKADFGTIKDSLRSQLKQMSDIYSDCLNILLLFEEGGKRCFIPLEKYLIRTFDQVKFALRKLRKSFTYLICIDEPYWKLDYRHFEMALFNLIKVMLVSTMFGTGGLITIRSHESGVLIFTAEFPYHQNYSLTNSRLEMRAVCHLFSLMNGKAEFCQELDKIICTGYIKTESSRKIRNVAHSMQLEPDLDCEKINERRKKGNDTYYNIYRRPERPYLKSEVDELEDVTDPKINFIELLLMNVDYNDYEN